MIWKDSESSLRRALSRATDKQLGALSRWSRGQFELSDLGSRHTFQLDLFPQAVNSNRQFARVQLKF